MELQISVRLWESITIQQHRFGKRPRASFENAEYLAELPLFRLLIT